MLGSIVLCPGAPAVSPTPIVWSAAAARTMRLDSRPLGVDPDGRARWLVRVHFLDAQGKPTRLVQAGDIEFSASRGDAQWQTRTRYGGPAAIVSTTQDGPLEVHAVSKDPAGLSDAVTDPDTRTWRAERVAARALGPHMVQIGWFPAARNPVTVVRSGSDGRRTVCTLSPPSSTCRDTGVRPGALYRYSIEGAGQQTDRAGQRNERSGQWIALPPVAVPAEAPRQSLDAFRGKGMWLRFSPDRRDDDAYDRLDARALVARAKSAGIRYVELRLAYGEFWEVTPAAKPYVDAFIDAAAREGIAVIAWTVPRAATYADLALATAAANYRTASGTRLAGVALDVERGDGYLGDGPAGASAIATYVERVREALGPAYLIVATVEDPYLNGLSNSDVPLAQIAGAASAIQPMTYWRMFEKAVTESTVRASVRESYLAVRRAAGRAIPINMGGQTTGIGPCGAPPPAEITGSLDASRHAGAIGETFYDWSGTRDPQWNAISSFRW